MTTKIRIFAILASVLMLTIVAVPMIEAETKYEYNEINGTYISEIEEDWQWDAQYWWEVPPMTSYERKQTKEIMIIVLDRYFGIDISTMNPEEFEELGCSIGREGKLKVLVLFWYYAEKRGFEPSNLFEIPRKFEELPETYPNYIPELYLWEIADLDEIKDMIIQQVAEAKEISPSEVEERFDELGPGVDLRTMTFSELSQFFDSLPKPPFRLVCLEEMKENPYTIAVFGTIPELSTECEIKEFDKNLDKVIDALFEIQPSISDLINSPNGSAIDAHRGVIEIWVYGDYVAEADEIYEIISKKAENILGIENVAVVFRGGMRIKSLVLSLPQAEAAPNIDASPAWALPPYGSKFRPIIGGIAKTATHPGMAASGSTIGFSIVERIGLWINKDYVVTGHLFGGRTPVGASIFQPTVSHINAAGRVIKSPNRTTFADVAQVGIKDGDVGRSIHVGGGMRGPVVGARDSIVGQRVWMSGARSGRSILGTVSRVNFSILNAYGIFCRLEDQVLIRGMYPRPGDSGGPVFTDSHARVTIHGILSGSKIIHGVPYAAIVSPISGVQRELGVEVLTIRG